jgi:hypothetical protein
VSGDIDAFFRLQMWDLFTIILHIPDFILLLLL